MRKLIIIIILIYSANVLAQEEDSVYFYVSNVVNVEYCYNCNDWKPIFTKDYHIKDYKMTIYNRWGEVIHEMTNPDKGWDGKYQDQLVEDGVYVWVLEYTHIVDENGDGLFELEEKEEHRGHVTILK